MQMCVNQTGTWEAGIWEPRQEEARPPLPRKGTEAESPRVQEQTRCEGFCKHIKYLQPAEGTFPPGWPPPSQREPPFAFTHRLLACTAAKQR